MVNDLETLYRMYQDDREFARHHESQRTNGSNLVIGISAALVGFVTYDGEISVFDVPASLLVVALGLFGIIFTEKHYERTRLHLYRAYQYYHKINELGGEDIDALRLAANKQSTDRFGWLSHLKLSWLWMLLHLFISITGVIMVFLAIST